MKKYKPKEIFCPSCGGKVGTYDGRSTINFIARCRKCNKNVVYNVDTGEIKLKPFSLRACGSGLTFI